MPLPWNPATLYFIFCFVMFLVNNTFSRLSIWPYVNRWTTIQILFSLSTDEPSCSVTLPQKTSNDCRSLREKELERQRTIYEFVPRPPMPMPRVNMTIPRLFAQFSKDEFLKEHLDNYIGMLKKNKDFTTKWLNEHPEELHNIQEYKDMFHDFRKKLASNVSRIILGLQYLRCRKRFCHSW